MDQEILALLERRPCSLEDVSLAFGISPENLAACLKELRKKGAVRYNIHNHIVFYRAHSLSSESYGIESMPTDLGDLP
jgi:biotin operon repressor